MRYIFHCEPDDFILAGRAIQSALNTDDWTGKICGIAFADGSDFTVVRNTKSISVWKCRQPKKEPK